MNETVNIGDLIQWAPNGVLQFKEPQKVVSISQCRQFVFIEGSGTGLPIKEVEVKKKGASKLQKISIILRDRLYKIGLTPIMLFEDDKLKVVYLGDNYFYGNGNFSIAPDFTYQNEGKSISFCLNLFLMSILNKILKSSPAYETQNKEIDAYSIEFILAPYIPNSPLETYDTNKTYSYRGMHTDILNGFLSKDHHGLKAGHQKVLASLMEIHDHIKNPSSRWYDKIVKINIY